ncbi:MAG TPA: 4Fe-4S dicluster domain-containing protein [Candidatus Limnocylindrales bacterium]|nr:4Fe-4S dicluster domain-containing protein [Candidatus Limnocylindrales bacterium]
MDGGAIVTVPLFLLVLYVAVGAFLVRATYLVRLVRAGRASERTGDLPVRTAREVVGVLGQSKLFLRLIPGFMHLLLFWGFLVLLPTIAMSFLGAMNRHWTIPWLGEQGWFALMVDLFAVGVLVGVTIAFTIRLGLRPVRFVGSYLQVAYNILLFEASITITLFLWHGSQIALGINEFPPEWAPVSNAAATLLANVPALEVFERVVVWIHALLILAFLVYIPYTKHLHTLVVWFNVFFERTRARGRLEPLVFDDPAVPEDQIRFGLGTIADMTWKQMVDGMTCTECGRCQDACPAFFTGKNLSPKLVVMGLRDQLYREGHAMLAAADGRGPNGAGGAAGPIFQGRPLVPTAVLDETVWDCVTCGACVRECPVGIEHIDHIVDLRRNLVMVESRFPAEGATMLRDLERTSNPWGRSPTERVDWAAGLDLRVLEPGDPAPDVLFWVGCAPAFDERARIGAISTARLLKEAGVDFAILGPRESCTGDPARRMGDEYTFQSLARQNVETLGESKITKIVTTCPHCFNTIANEYPDFGGHYEVVHHTQFLAELIRDGRLRPAPGGGTITYHDSCYLARHNDVRAEPRELVAAVGRPIEMRRREERPFCCGAGGAHMWLEERAGQINEERAREATATGASTLAVACPFCTVMLDDGMQSTGGGLVVKDVATLLVEAVERGRALPVIDAAP